MDKSEIPSDDGRIEAAVFDLDGTLIDSEPLYEEADRLFLARYGLSWKEIRWEDMVGIGGKEFIRMLQEDFGLTGDPHDLRTEKDEIYLGLARSSLTVFPEMLELVKKLQRDGMPLAIATGSSSDVLTRTSEFAGLARYFSVFVSADEVPRGKPAPDVFLEAAERLGVPGARCLAVEDSQYGVEAAKVAGMTCIAVPTVLTNPLPERFSRADLLFEKGMTQFSADRTYQWISERTLNRSGVSRI